MTEENTEFEKPQGEADSDFMFFLRTTRHQPKHILCNLQLILRCVVNNRFFPNKKRHLVKTGKVCGPKSTAATQRPYTPSMGFAPDSGRRLNLVHAEWVFSLPIDFLS